jgi:hypothetical protein
VPRVEVSGEHMVHPSGGDHVVDRWTLITWEGVNTMLTPRSLGSYKKGALGLDTQAHEVASCEKC